MKRDENGDIVFAQLDEDGKLTFAPDVAPYDPMFNGKWVEIDGVEVKMPDYDFSQHDWVLRVDSDIGWTTFWRCAPCGCFCVCGIPCVLRATQFAALCALAATANGSLPLLSLHMAPAHRTCSQSSHSFSR